MAIEILIVDDNADIRNILNELILDAGYKTRVAANYNQALSEIDKKIPDVAILDVKLDRTKLVIATCAFCCNSNYTKKNDLLESIFFI